MGLLPKLKTKISVEAYLEGEKFSRIRQEYNTVSYESLPPRSF